MEIIDIIKLVAPEFEEVSDEDICAWVHLCEPFVDKKVFGVFYTQAVAYLACHKMKLAGAGSEASGGVGAALGAVGSGYGITSISAGQSSISFAAGIASSAEQDAEFMRTQYGLQFVQLRKLVVVPITISP